jgi:hypothetical protein
MPVLSPRQLAWTLGKIERELELLTRGKRRRFVADFDDSLRVEIAVRLTSKPKGERIEDEQEENGT